MNTISRRKFLGRTALAGAAFGFPDIIPATALGKDGKLAPSERVGIGVIACGSRAGYTRQYQRYAKSQIVAVCDPVKSKRDNFSKRYGNAPAYNDFRELLARKDVDAVHIATADHWHVPIAIMAAKAGKDMYTEKPLGISIAHDIAARQIVDKYKRVFQYGAQQRSMEHVRRGIELVLNGHIGDVRQIYVWAPRGAEGGSPTPVLPVPDGFDYDMWLGPAPKAPFCKSRCIRGGGQNGIFHIYDYAIGFIAGWGAHPLDMMQWWADNAGMKEIPVHYEGTGRIPTEGLFNTLVTWDMTCTFANGIKMRFMDSETLAKMNPKPHPGAQGGHGTLFVGTKGWVMVSRGGWKFSPKNLREKVKNPGSNRLKVSRDQIQNLVDCVLTREEPVDNLHSAVRSDIISHLCELCVRTGRPLTWDPKKETIVGNEDAAKRMARPLRAPWTLA
jgi:predicted dehydrogenase